MVDFAELKRFFFFNLIGSLIVSALVAVVAVLIGEFNEVTRRAFATLLMVVIHSFVCLAFIWDDERQNTFGRFAFFINIIFLLIVASFLVSIFGIWNVIPMQTVWDIYQTFFVIAFASLHGNILAKALDKENYMDLVVYLNYLFMAIVVLMLQPIIYVENATRVLGDMFFRILGAVAIIDGTLTILTIIFYKLYVRKHKQEQNALGSESPEGKVEKGGLSIWVWLLLIYLAVQIGFPIIYFLAN